MALGRCKKKLKHILERNKDPSLARDPGGASIDEPKSNTVGRPIIRRERRKAKWKRARRATLAVASHAFDVLQPLSEVFGPLKAVVSCVGHGMKIWRVWHHFPN